jgi:hypothetical protein
MKQELVKITACFKVQNGLVSAQAATNWKEKSLKPMSSDMEDVTSSISSNVAALSPPYVESRTTWMTPSFELHLCAR